jgi:hypothetical protein
MNQLHAIAMNEGKRTKLWSEQGRAELEKLRLAPWASRRRGLVLLLRWDEKAGLRGMRYAPSCWTCSRHKQKGDRQCRSLAPGV